LAFVENTFEGDNQISFVSPNFSMFCPLFGLCK